MTLNGKGMFALTALVLLFVALWAYQLTGNRLPGSHDLVVDDYETLPQNLFDPVDTKVYHFCPKEMIPNAIYSRHRYPLYAGHNFSLLIHKGFAPLMRAAERDPAWYDNPPSEMAGYSL